MKRITGEYYSETLGKISGIVCYSHDYDDNSSFVEDGMLYINSQNELCSTKTFPEQQAVGFVMKPPTDGTLRFLIQNK